MYWVQHAGFLALGLVLAAVLVFVGILFFQAQKKPDNNSRYVALGSSFAAGAGLGKRAPGSPVVCLRSSNGYPQQLARLLGISFTDMSCSGSTVKHVLHGGQFFLGSQIDALGPKTELVTITSGGNDISYVGDLVMLSHKNRGGIFGFYLDRLWKGAKPVAERKITELKNDFAATLHEIRVRAPNARIVVVTYPLILPATGTGPQIQLSETDAAMMRDVGKRLADVTREVAQVAGALLVDMDALSVGHDACSAEPWMNGAKAEKGQGIPFHPNLAGAEATAKQVLLALQNSSGVHKP